MRHQVSIGITALALSLFAGCEQPPSEVEAQAREAQRRADDAIAEARREADQKVAKAQSKADDEARRADAVFIKARDDLRTKVNKEMDELSKRVDGLEARAANAGNRRRAELTEALRSIDEKRTAVKRDIAAIEATTADDFEVLKAGLEARIDELKKAVDEATSRM